ncbi:hypothetical protein Vau01_069820 [Virgisporangium aurantiacum]|uniref:Uncharacterized protein n=2 Tax=Virgisporangium aurantiacum TaxID=175570 RepID=A0A8J3ZD67_9ACTN|nr:hypothetical protein Vau01_069820 [Virgisporangium aurantiacum]
MVSNDLAEFLRTMVKGDAEANDRIERKLDAEGWTGWPIFLAYCFYLAVDRYFKRPADAGEIVRFVADIRAWVGDDGPSIDPVMAERLIRSVLDEDMDIDTNALDQEMLGHVETAVVYAVLTRSNMSDVELDSFFAEAKKLASARLEID